MTSQPRARLRAGHGVVVRILGEAPGSRVTKRSRATPDGAAARCAAATSARCPFPAACTASAPGTFPPWLWSVCAAPSPIGLTAAALFAGGEGSRADWRVRAPGSFTCARCPARTSGLDAGPESYDNPAAVWWGTLCSFRGHRGPGGHTGFAGTSASARLNLAGQVANAGTARSHWRSSVR